MGNDSKRRKGQKPPEECDPKRLRSIDLSEYLSNEAWLRRLARSLIADEGRVNELVQYVLTEALKHKPTHLKSWAQTVMRRAVVHLRVSEWRRSKREKAVAREEKIDPGVPEPDRRDTRERLAGLVRELEEPYRQTMILHFFEDLSYEEVAVRQQVPVATVRTRVQRALAQMRQKLRAHYGEPSKWVFALGPVAGLKFGSMPTGGGLSKPSAVKFGGYGAVGVAAALLLGFSATMLLALPSPDGMEQTVEQTAVAPAVDAGEESMERSAMDESFRVSEGSEAGVTFKHESEQPLEEDSGPLGMVPKHSTAVGEPKEILEIPGGRPNSMWSGPKGGKKPGFGPKWLEKVRNDQTVVDK